MPCKMKIGVLYFPLLDRCSGYALVEARSVAELPYIVYLSYSKKLGILIQ